MAVIDFQGKRQTGVIFIEKELETLFVGKTVKRIVDGCYFVSF